MINMKLLEVKNLNKDFDNKEIVRIFIPSNEK